jgi:Sulfatase-modifying factor enzyme 1
MLIISPLCVLPPDTVFAQIHQTLTTLGWQQQADPTAPPVLIADEPDMAVWVNPATDDRLTYTFHPAMRLRVLMVEGSQATEDIGQLSANLPTLTAKDAERLMQSLEIESLLLGIAIADVLDAIGLLDVVAALMEHPDSLIAQEASRVFQHLLSQTTNLSLGLLAEWKMQHPDHSVLFRLLGSAQERRQVLRWLMHDRPNSNPAIDATLRTALEDPDWEVRVTALLAAARLKAFAVRKFVHRAKLPDSTAIGLDVNDRRILLALHQAALALIDGQSPPPQTDTPLTTKEVMRDHIMRCIADLPVTWHDRVFLLIHALTHPLPAEIPSPKLPAGIRHQENGYYLIHSNLPLVWVPPIPHWLGDERASDPSQSIREVIHPLGFFISQTLISLDSQLEHYVRCNWEEAQQQCLKLSQQASLKIRLPTADEWEMAVRGPDGRRFPWGNGLEQNWRNTASPWGVQNSVGILEQWTSTRSAPDGAIVCGSLTKFGCAGRSPASLNKQNVGFRLLVETV